MSERVKLSAKSDAWYEVTMELMKCLEEAKQKAEERVLVAQRAADRAAERLAAFDVAIEIMRNYQEAAPAPAERETV